MITQRSVENIFRNINKKKKLNYETAMRGDFENVSHQYGGIRDGWINWKRFLDKRRADYPIEEFHSDTNKIVDKVKEDGYIILKDFFNKDDLMDLKNEFDHFAKNGLKQNVLPGSIYGKEDEIKGKALWYSIDQPFLEMDNVFKIVCRDDIISIAAHYFKCLPACTGLNFRRSYVNDTPGEHTNLFHQDGNSPDFFKMFIYLNDVDEEGGPFCVVKGSHINKSEGCYDKYRWDKEEIHSIYGEENIKYITANFGDLILGSTVGFHRGIKPISKERTMLTLDWGIHPSYFKQSWGTKMKRSDYDSLEDWKKPITDYLVKE